MLTKGKTVLEAENRVDIEFDKVMEWASNNKINYNETKSQLMLATRKRSLLGREIDVFLNNEKLKQVRVMKYLGIQIDDQLRCDKHAGYITEKCGKTVHALARSAKIFWGLREKALDTIYKGAILPILAYGVPACIDALQRRSNQIKLKT
ncbi:hypothetical protein QE152_g15819 [Popillia japonica]|uniref:Reverse transcriptase n=1 Tax=Popillia japonica TaxID=7064 RepID=A0AAW1L6W7_POPJA